MTPRTSHVVRRPIIDHDWFWRGIACQSDLVDDRSILNTKKLIPDTRKHSSPKVSSCGKLAKWVSFIPSVSGSTSATTTMYIHPANPYSARVRLTSRAILRPNCRLCPLRAIKTSPSPICPYVPLCTPRSIVSQLGCVIAWSTVSCSS